MEIPMLSRRMLLKTTASGFGYLAFASLASWASERNNPLAPRQPHFPARAKRVIFMCMEGGPSHVDTFDYKPRLQADDGRNFTRGRLPGGRLLGSPWRFTQHGQGGLAISELFPELARHADDLCLLRGMHTDQPNHPQAFMQMHTGMFQFPRPSLGAWTLYGLGSENENLPGFVTINPPNSNGGPANYGSSFLPAVYQGTRIGGGGFGGGGFGGGGGTATVSNVRSPRTAAAQRTQLDYIQQLNQNALDADPAAATVEGMIQSYELGYRMQDALPRVLDVANESAAVRQRYGIGTQATENFGRQCLMARRLVEAGVRFVEISSGGWDHHTNLRDNMVRNCGAIDKPIAGLLGDLKSRGMLDDTLVIWGGEFGRTPYAQGTNGRDHNSRGYTIWMAGGGVRGGLSYGNTDEYGYEAVEKRTHIHDWHATILHLLGLDHERLTYRHAGRDFRLTDVSGVVAQEIVR
jgi:hypothetical protein